MNWGNDLGASNTLLNNSFRGTFGALTQANGIVTESFTGGNNGFNYPMLILLLDGKNLKIQIK